MALTPRSFSDNSRMSDTSILSDQHLEKVKSDALAMLERDTREGFGPNVAVGASKRYNHSPKHSTNYENAKMTQPQRSRQYEMNHFAFQDPENSDYSNYHGTNSIPKENVIHTKESNGVVGQSTPFKNDENNRSSFNNLTEEKMSLLREIKNLKDKEERLNLDVQNLQNLVNEKDRANDTLLMSKSKLEANMQMHKQELTKEIESLKYKQIVENNDTQLRIESLNDLTNRLKSDLKETLSKQDKLKLEIEEKNINYENREKKIDELLQKNAELEIAVKQYKIKNEQLEITSGENITEISKLQESVREIEISLDRKEIEIKSFKDTIEEFKKKENIQNEKIQEINNELLKKSDEIIQMKNTINDKDEEIEKFKSSQNMHENTISEKNKEIQAQSCSFEKEKDTFISQITLLQKNLSDISLEKEELIKENTKLKNSNDQIENEGASLKKNLHDIEEKLKTLQGSSSNTLTNNDLHELYPDVPLSEYSDKLLLDDINKLSLIKLQNLIKQVVLALKTPAKDLERKLPLMVLVCSVESNLTMHFLNRLCRDLHHKSVPIKQIRSEAFSRFKDTRSFETWEHPMKQFLQELYLILYERMNL